MDLTGISIPVIAGAVIITGLVVVFVALVGLWGIVALFGKIFTSIADKKKPDAPSAPKQPPVVAAAPAAPKHQPMKIETGVNGEVVAAIAAAIAAISGGTEVIHSVKRVRQARSNWAQAGLVQNTQQF